MKTVYQLTPQTKEAEDWIEDNIQYEGYQKLGKGVVIEARYIDSIVAGMVGAGLETDRDFSIV